MSSRSCFYCCYWECHWTNHTVKQARYFPPCVLPACVLAAYVHASSFTSGFATSHQVCLAQLSLLNTWSKVSSRYCEWTWVKFPNMEAKTGCQNIAIHDGCIIQHSMHSCQFLLSWAPALGYVGGYIIHSVVNKLDCSNNLKMEQMVEALLTSVI